MYRRTRTFLVDLCVSVCILLPCWLLTYGHTQWPYAPSCVTRAQQAQIICTKEWIPNVILTSSRPPRYIDRTSKMTVLILTKARPSLSEIVSKCLCNVTIISQPVNKFGRLIVLLKFRILTFPELNSRLTKKSLV